MTLEGRIAVLAIGAGLRDPGEIDVGVAICGVVRGPDESPEHALANTKPKSATMTRRKVFIIQLRSPRKRPYCGFKRGPG